MIKYEDLVEQPEFQLQRIIKFLKNYIPIKTDNKKNNKILETTSFENLKDLEEKGTFEENAFQSSNIKKTFFNLGPKNNWKEVLDKKIKEEIEIKLSNEMEELGYLK